MKQLKMILTGLIASALILAAGAGVAKDTEEKTLNRAIIRVESLTCGACFSTINAGLSTLDGFSGMGANLFRKLIAVDYSEPLTQAEISEKLDEVGYPGEIKTVKPITEVESFAAMESKTGGYGGCGRTGSCSREGAPKLERKTPGGSCCRNRPNDSPSSGQSI